MSRSQAYRDEEQPIGIDDHSQIRLLGQLECRACAVLRVLAPSETRADDEHVLSDPCVRTDFRGTMEEDGRTSRSKMPFSSVLISSIDLAGSRIPWTIRSG